MDNNVLIVDGKSNNIDLKHNKKTTSLMKFTRGRAGKSNGHSLAYSVAKGERIDDYEINGLYFVFYHMAGEVFNEEYSSLSSQDREKHLFKMFNDVLSDYRPNYIFNSDAYSNGTIVRLDDSLFDGLFLSYEDNRTARKLLEQFNSVYEQIITTIEDKSSNLLDSLLANNYLDAYLNLCRFVFKPNCLNQEELRTQRIIEKILNVDYNKDKECFGLYSPFVVFAVLRTIKYIAALPDDINHSAISENCEELNSRKHILATYAIRSISRFTIIDKKSYVVEYSRRNDKIICKDVQKVSSIDNVKPIRLFEKITSYIYNSFKEEPTETNKDFVVSVYGFCWFGSKKSPNPVEVDDLIYEIFSWFEDKRKYDEVLKDRVINKLIIKYYLISDSEEEYELPFVYKYTEDSGRIYTCDFQIVVQKYDKYNNKQLSNVIRDSNIIFVLDCPWLATEDYNLGIEGDIDSYSRWVRNVSFHNDLDQLFVPPTKAHSFFDRVHLFASINDQFSRLAVNSKQLKYGRVVRVMKDYLLGWIQQQIERYKIEGKYKTIYIYNSSLRGMAYSNYALYPIIREESYSNKRFTIMKFSTRTNDCVPKQKKDKIYISLWSLLKYVDISFAFVGIKKWFSQNFSGMIKETNSKRLQEKIINRDIVSILRNIVFVVDYSKNKNEPIQDINIKIVLSRPIREKYYDSQNEESIKDIVGFFENILKEIIFKNSSGLGDCCIREAFERCLYNQSKSVNDLFFLHLYSLKKENQSLSDFKVYFNSHELGAIDYEVDNLVPNFDSFSDKRAYQKLFDYLDVLNVPEYAVRSLLNQVDKIYKKEYSYSEYNYHSTEILHNIKIICELNNYTSSNMYKNIIHFTNQ